MDLGYHKTYEISTNDLPFVVCNIELVFGFNNSPAYWFSQAIRKWSKDLEQETEDKQETIRLAAHLLKHVKTPDGEFYQLGTIESIEILIKETDYNLITNIIAGWTLLKANEQLKDKKKSLMLSQLSTANNAKKNQVKES